MELPARARQPEPIVSFRQPCLTRWRATGGPIVPVVRDKAMVVAVDRQEGDARHSRGEALPVISNCSVDASRMALGVERDLTIGS